MEENIKTQGQAYVMLSRGFEEIEALMPVDFLRRAQVAVSTVAVEDSQGLAVEGAHGIVVHADCALSDVAGTIAEEEHSIIVLPGGMPGAANLAQSVLLQTLLVQHHEHKRTLAAICAAPAKVLAPLGILRGKKFTCYPSAKNEVVDATFIDQALVEDANIITSQGVATAPLFAKRLVELLAGKELATTVWRRMLYPLTDL